ncbi:hypothetical protein [Bradyrhizobium valentinum]|uniref:hypothetical protein n=1 Tax=Bradyrhizobium valentinum TaxID=1518501 RepID=UPI000A7F731B|nr:hypothetical protein [Bradyrhizobium valentinum]
MRGVIAASLLCLAVSLTGAKADTPLDILGVEKSVNDVARRAQETGDAVARAFAEQALKVIGEWKKANAELINLSFDRLDDQSKKMFTEINNVATRIEKGAAITFVDLQRTMATAGDTIARVPGASKDPAVSFTRPTIILPSGEPTINIHIIGSRLANAKPTVSFGDKPLQVKKISDNEISFDVDRQSLNGDKGETKSSLFLLRYEVDKAKWYNPFSWGSTETRERNVEVKKLPGTPGNVTVIPTVREETWETRVDGPKVVGGRGKDAPFIASVTIIPELQEQGWVIDKAAQKSAQFDDNGGDGDGGSSCVGYSPDTFTDKSFGFHIQHGHKTSGLSKSDAHQNCRVWIHMKRRKIEEKPAAELTKPLDWLSDVDFPLPKNTVSSVIKAKMYDGRVFSVQGDRQIPYGLFELFLDKDAIKFRPRPQRDF